MIANGRSGGRTIADEPLLAGSPGRRRWLRRPAVIGTADARKGRGYGLAFWAAVAFIATLLLAPQAYFPVLGVLRVALLTAMTASAACIINTMSSGRPLFKARRELKILGCLVVWAIVTVPFSLWPGGSVDALLNLYTKSVVTCWLLSQVLDSTRKVRTLAVALSVIAVPLAFTGIRNYVSGTFFGNADRIVGYGAALTANPNDLALMLNLILPFIIALALAARAATHVLLRPGLIGVAALTVVAVVLTFSRAGSITLATIGILYLVMAWRRGRKGIAATVVLVAVAALLIAPSSYLSRMGTIADIDSDPTGSAQARWAEKQAAVGFVVRHPVVGAGIAMNILALNEELGPLWHDVHDVYLQYAVDLGIPGLFLFLAFFGRTLRNLRRARRRAETSGQAVLARLAEGVEVSLIAFAVSGLFYPVAYHVYFYLLAGVALGIGHISMPPQDISDRPTADWPRGSSLANAPGSRQ